jgi:ankyrin repeat protein
MSLWKKLFGTKKTAHSLSESSPTENYSAPAQEQVAEFLDAAKEGNMEKVRAMLGRSPALVSCEDQYGRTPLHRAAEYDRREVAELLVANGAETNARATGGIFQSATPLHIAASTGSTQVLKLLLANKAEINAKMLAGHFHGSTPLRLASMQNRKEAVELLRQHGGYE